MQHNRGTSIPNNNSGSNNESTVYIPIFPDISDVDYVRINVTGDGSCFYRALFLAAYMYPLDEGGAADEIKDQLLPEFAGVNNLLLTILHAFGYTKQRLMNEDYAVKFMRNQISKGLSGISGNEEFDGICQEHYLTFFNSIKDAYNTSPEFYSYIIGDASYEIQGLFADPIIRDHLLAADKTVSITYLADYLRHLNNNSNSSSNNGSNNGSNNNAKSSTTSRKSSINYSNFAFSNNENNGLNILKSNNKSNNAKPAFNIETIKILQIDPKDYFLKKMAETVSDFESYASDIDITLIQKLLLRKNIVCRTTRLEKINTPAQADQKFPIIELRRPVLLIDNVGELHYKALVPVAVYEDNKELSFDDETTLEDQVSREPSKKIKKKNSNGKAIVVIEPGKPIIFSKRTFAYRKAKRLRGGRKTLKRKQRN